jgi:hypothetical protein
MAGERRRLQKDSRAAGFRYSSDERRARCAAAAVRAFAFSYFGRLIGGDGRERQRKSKNDRLATDNNLPQGHRVAAPDVKSYEQITADIELTNAHLKWQDERFLQTEGRYSAPRGNCVKHGLNSIA